MIPVDFKVGAETQFVRHSRAKNAGEVDQADLVASGREAKIWARNDPSTPTIEDLKAQRMGPVVVTLCDGYIDG